MTREEQDKAIRILQWLHNNNFLFRSTEEDVKFATEYAIEALEQEPKIGHQIENLCTCTNKACIFQSRIQSGILRSKCDFYIAPMPRLEPDNCGNYVVQQEPKIGYCKDCKWWKDSDGAFRRGIGAESICRINTDIVYQGEGYCYLFEPKESEE